MLKLAIISGLACSIGVFLLNADAFRRGNHPIQAILAAFIIGAIGGALFFLLKH